MDTQQEKVATLSASLATVMQQKSKMEASYQADKKKMMVGFVIFLDVVIKYRKVYKAILKHN